MINTFIISCGGIKTVSTFCDKPAQAMAQIALCKMVEESQATNPDVAKVLTSNVYMDNIFDSVDIAEEALRLNKDISSVLKKENSGWISNKDLIKTDREKISERTN